MIKLFNTVAGAVLGAILMVIPAVGGIAAAPSTPPPALKADLAALVNGVPISRQQYGIEVKQLIEKETIKGRTLNDAELLKLKQDAINLLINRELLYQKSVASGLTVDDNEISEYIAVVRAQFDNEADYQQHLTQIGLDEPAFAEHSRKIIGLRKFVDENIRQSIEISEADAQQFYEAHPEIFRPNEEIRVRQLLIKVAPEADAANKAQALSKIQALKLELDKGADFQKLAKQRSEGPEAQKGGDMGFVRRGQTAKPIEDAAFALQPGQVSEPVTTNSGFHLIQLVERKPGNAIEFSTVQHKIVQNLKQDRAQRNMNAILEAANKEADIKRFAP